MLGHLALSTALFVAALPVANPPRMYRTTEPVDDTSDTAEPSTESDDDSETGSTEEPDEPDALAPADEPSTDPATSSVPVEDEPSTTNESTPAPRAASTSVGDWALGGAIAGLAVGGVFYTLRGVAEANDDPTTAQQISLTSSADLLFLAAVPIMAAAGASARRNPQVRGVIGLRISGWLSYALGGLSFAAIDVLEDINVSRVNDGKSRNEQLEVSNVWRGFAYALTATSLLTMGADTIISHVQAQRLNTRTSATRVRTSRAVQVWPSLLVDLDAHRRPAVAAGLLGRF